MQYLEWGVLNRAILHHKFYIKYFEILQKDKGALLLLYKIWVPIFIVFKEAYFLERVDPSGSEAHPCMSGSLRREGLLRVPSLA